MSQVSGSSFAKSYLRSFMNCNRFKKAFVFTGNRSFNISGAEKLIVTSLRNINWHRFSVNSGLLTPESVNQGAKSLAENAADVVIAIGGGSVIDCAKCACYIAGSGRLLSNLGEMNSSTVARKIPVIAIPTTSGTGAEVTPFATIWVGGKKKTVEHRDMVPLTSLCVPSLLKSQSSYLLACCTLDALTQAVEASWSVRSTSESRRIADSAIDLIWPELVRMSSGFRPKFRALGIGARLSGEAISVSRTTACHALSYPLTARHGIPHGHAVAITLPEILEYVGLCQDHEAKHPLVAAEVRARAEQVAFRLGAKSVVCAKTQLERILKGLGIERSLARLGCGGVDAIEGILSDAMDASRMDNLPRVMDRNDAELLLKRIL